MTKDVWKYATTMLGAPSAMTDGIPWMLMLFVVSLDSQIKVDYNTVNWVNCYKLHDNEIYRSCSKAFSILWSWYW